MTKDNILAGCRILIIAADGFEQSELEVPLQRLEDAGAEVEIASIDDDDITGWDEDDWGDEVEVDLKIADVDTDRYDALVLPGGQINPDLLRVEDKAISIIRAFSGAGKPVAAICHAPWLLVEAGLASGKRMTSYKSIRTDVANAGAQVVDESVVVDGNIITSRCPDDLPDFCDAIVAAVADRRARA
ncbi:MULTISPECIES: type 1 glutamine amidotransferase domain-containing protein [unclassified Sphingopyxis]|uniref:type 1 glutamine amidotransferase domain-containing protein n=1 Tax=unclassified Sphingopyxis TaxID=2614943 RepID=UPI002078B7D6|nr:MULTISPECIES: type 1 glutamine amidotransferase domain-containing protein [unclassified Sphingopyxis]MDR7060541.1 protease I [Sphingopyxis sp. BE235]MDR7179946.1 protease I [Sphingopyxis sp. BE249]USI75332.1 type 1 glutamine amidotransferase [Sphingopyxis sp. USTB-05]